MTCQANPTLSLYRCSIFCDGKGVGFFILIKEGARYGKEQGGYNSAININTSNTNNNFNIKKKLSNTIVNESIINIHKSEI